MRLLIRKKPVFNGISGTASEALLNIQNEYFKTLFHIK